MADGSNDGDPLQSQLRQRRTVAYSGGDLSEVIKPSKELYNAANYLLNGKVSGLKLRSGVLNGKRVSYFRGKSGCSALMREAYGSAKGPSVTNRDEALQVIEQLLMHSLIIRCERGEAHSAGGRALQPHPLQSAQEDSYYACIYEGSQLGIVLGGFALIGVVLAGVMFPLWPQFMRDGAWYLSVGVLGLLGLLLLITIIRLIVFIITYVILNPGLWIFPNLYEDVGFFDSFVPFWAWAETAKKQGKRPATAATNAASEKAHSAPTAPLLENVTEPDDTSAVATAEEDGDEVEEIIAD